jgi:CheY-like chemotaxis protein
MTRALVVHHDIDLADQEVESLRRLGYEVTECSGPTANACPVLNGAECSLAAIADVLVYDAFASGDSAGSGDLISGLRKLHPDVPIVVTTPGIGYSWEPAGDAGVVELQGQPTGANLHQAIQQAIASRDEEPADRS